MNNILNEINKIEERRKYMIEQQYKSLLNNMDDIQKQNWELVIVKKNLPKNDLVEIVRHLKQWLQTPEAQKQPFIPQQCYMEQLILDNSTGNRMSVELNKNSPLYKKVMDIRRALMSVPSYYIEPQYHQPGIQLTELNNYGQRMGPHVEIVDKTHNNNLAKGESHKQINGNKIDLCKKSNWYCQGGGFSLFINQGNKYHKNPLHITVAYFGTNQNCTNILIQAQAIVETVLKIKLHN